MPPSLRHGLDEGESTTVTLTFISILLYVHDVVLLPSYLLLLFKVGCTVMAVLLHYFLLTVFCWMLCEGILLYLVIVKVTGAIVEEKVKWFLIFGWGTYFFRP